MSKKWSKEDDARGQEIWEKTHSIEDVASVLGRTREAVKLRKILRWGVKERQVRVPMDYTKTWQDEALVEWTDGFLLGDGHLAETSAAGIAAYAAITSANRDWTRYAMIGFGSYYPLPPKENWVGDGRGGKRNHLAWQSSTLSHPDLKVHRDRWYPGGKKRIPQDVRLTGTSLRLWYIGDGSLENGFVRLAACDFTREELEPVVDRLRAERGLDFHFGTGIRLYLAAKSIPAFFDFIGRECPVEGYEYKFEASPDRWLRTIEGTARELGVRPFWIRYLIQSGRAGSVKREKLRFIAPEDFEKIKEIRDTEYMPRKAGVNGCGGLTQYDVTRRLRVHWRRLPDLIAQAGLAPRRTGGGHYRFTEDDVAKMEPFVGSFFHDKKVRT